MEKGCNLGNQVFPNSTNLFNVPFNPDVERFINNEPIIIRWWDEDPNCGIRDNKLINTHKRCIVGNQYGTIVDYNQQDIKCLPIDNGILMLLALLILLIYLRFKR